MANNNILRLHRKLFLPLVGLLWLIIGITITYFVINERQRLKYNLENRLVNVNNTVIEAYENGNDLQKTVVFFNCLPETRRLIRCASRFTTTRE